MCAYSPPAPGKDRPAVPSFLFSAAVAMVIAWAGIGSSALAWQEPAIEGSKLYDRGMLGRAGNPNEKARIVLPGMSILPPQGVGWIEGPPMPRVIAEMPRALAVFFKVVRQPDPSSGMISVVAQVRASRVSRAELDSYRADRKSFVAYIARSMEAGLKNASERLRLKSFTTQPDLSLGTDCLSGERVVEDAGVPGYPGLVFTETARFYLCAHPYDEVIIEIGYGQRTPPTMKPYDIRNEGDAFIKSLRFTKQ